jgi:ketosteroid isomerase-like protein
MSIAADPVTARKAAIQRLYVETNAGNYDFLDELLAPDFVSYGGAGFMDLSRARTREISTASRRPATR